MEFTKDVKSLETMIENQKNRTELLSSEIRNKKSNQDH